MHTIEFEITGEQKMHCVGCETRVAYVLRQLPTVRDVRASAKTQRIQVFVHREEGAGAEIIQRKLKALGYDVQQLRAAG